VTTKPPVKGAPRKGKRKGGRKEVSDVNGTVARGEPATSTANASPHWGLFEPVRPVFEPFVAMLRPFVNSQVVIAVLFVLLAYSWLFPTRGGNGIGRAGYTPPERIAAYEEIWRREESALWDWLEDRVGFDGVHAPPIQKQDQQNVMSASSLSRDLDEQRMSERQMDAAIKSTEQKLAALKEAVGKRKTKRAPKS
jgi:hypothetical protein